MGIKGTQIKMTGERTFGGYGVVFGGKDLEGDYFTPDTEFWLDYLKPQAILFDHTQTPLPPNAKQDEKKDWVIARIKSVKMDDVGLWVEGILDEHKEWLAYVKEMIDQGILGYSSDSIAHLVERAPDGWLKSWPVPFWSVTHHPAEPRTGIHFLKQHQLNEIADYLSEATLKALQAKAARGGAETSDPDNANHEVTTTMFDNLVEREPFVRALVDSHWDQLVEQFETKGIAVKMDGEEEYSDSDKGQIETMLQPIAEQLSGALGIGADEVMGDLMSYIAEKMQGGTTTEVDAEQGYDEEPMMLNIDMDKFAKAYADATKPATGAAGHARKSKTYRAPATIKQRGEPEPLSLGRQIRAMRDGDLALLKKHRPMIADAYKQQGINPDTAGGYLVTPEQSDQIIEFLRAESIMAPLVTEVPMNKDRLFIPKQTGGVTVYWVGENSQITDSDADFGQIELQARKMAVLVKVSNELLDDADPNVDSYLRTEIGRAMASEYDRVLFQGSGVGDQPRGLLNTSGITSTASTNPTGYADLVDMVERVESANVMTTGNWAWAMHPKAKAVLRQIEDGASQYIWTGSDGIGRQAAGDVAGDLLGYNWVSTTNTGLDGNSRPRLFFGNWSDVVVGLRKSIEIVASNQAGTSFEYDQTWIRAIIRMDTAIRHEESVEILTALRLS